MPANARTLTFLFTDIEGSTTLWETRPEEMSVALRRHDEILREAIVEAGGAVFKTGGDAFYAVFESPPAAVRGAIAIQDALANESWPGPDLRIRVAVHTGEVEERDEDYFGPTLNSVARLLSAGHGEQILLSAVTFALARDYFEPGVDVLAMGSHRLKDLRRPMEIFQIVRPGLRANFPALRTLSARPHNLPLQLTSFVGREREVSDAISLLKVSRLVTLTGPGGTGKTRLAVQVAEGALDDFKHGVWFVDLAPLSDPEGVPSAVARALGLRDDPEAPILATLTAYLAERQLLLVLDNCEHVVVGCTTLADAILSASPGTRILATSREPLVMDGERRMPVPTLSVPPASGSNPEMLRTISTYESVQLFVDRAVAAASRFELTAANVPAVAKICSRLDGVPLAIELAAARVTSLSVEQIAARLDDRFRLLTGGSRTALPRQQTLRATIDWSYELLTEPERMLLRRLSVFSGGWTLEAAEAVCSGGAVHGSDVLDLLARLVERSLVLFEDEPSPRYGFLENIRQYAGEKLAEAGETQVTRDNHLAWCVAFVEEAAPEFWSNDSIAWHARVAADHANVRAVLEWAASKDDPPIALMRIVGALPWFWLVQGHVREGDRWSNEAVRRSIPNRSPERAGAMHAAGWLLFVGGDSDRGQVLFERCLADARESNDSRRMIAALWGLGEVRGSGGHFEQARADLEEALLLNATFGADDKEANWREVVLYNTLGNAASMAERDPDVYYEKAVELARQRGLRAVAAAPLGNLGDSARRRGELGLATQYYEEGMEIMREMGASGMLGIGLVNLAYLARSLGDTPTAIHRLREVRDSARDSWVGGVSVVLAAAGVFLLAGRPLEGTRALGAGQRHQSAVDPVDRDEQIKDRDALMIALGQEAFEREYVAGQAMTSEEAERFVSDVLDELAAALL